MQSSAVRNPITVLHTEWACGWGGQEMRVLRESVAFQARGLRMLIACQPGSPLMTQAQAAGVPAVPLRMRKGPDPSAILKIMSIIRREAVDVVHTHSSVDAWKCGFGAKLMGVPVVRSRHLGTPSRPGPVNRFLYGCLADRVITSGQSIKDALVRNNRIDPERIVSIPAGVDVDRFHPGVDGTAVRRELSVGTDEFVVMTLDVMRRDKGHSYLIEAVKSLSDEMPVRLLMLGTGPQEQNLRRMVADLGLEGRVRMLGYRGDVPACIAAADCVVLASTANEATSQVIPQAQAMRKPVISTNVGGLGEVVTHQRTGVVVPPASADALADSIRWIFRNAEAARELAVNGHRQVHERFTFERMISDTEAVYRTVISASRTLRACPAGT